MRVCVRTRRRHGAVLALLALLALAYLLLGGRNEQQDAVSVSP